MIIIFEYCYQEINIFFTYIEFTEILAIIILSQLLRSLFDSTEKYLFEFDYMNPFLVLFYEGLFGFILTFSYFLYSDYLHDIVKVYEENIQLISLFYSYLCYLLILYYLLEEIYSE